MAEGIISIDLGTSRIKGGVIAGTEVVCESHVPFPVESKEGRREAKSEVLWKTVYELVGGLAKESKKSNIEIRAIGISSQAQTFVPIGKNGKPLSNFILWDDYRGREEARLLAQNSPEFSKVSGFGRPLPAHFSVKLLYLKRNLPEIFHSAEKFLLLKEWIILKLTGFSFGDQTDFGMGREHISTRGVYAETENSV